MKTKNNAAFINQELESLERVIFTRLKLYFKQEAPYQDITQVPWANPMGYQGNYVDFVLDNHLQMPERLCLALSVASLLKPQLLEAFYISNNDTGWRFVEFGCVQDTQSTVLLPSVHTLLFLLCGVEVEARIAYLKYFAQHQLFTHHMVMQGGLQTNIQNEAGVLQLQKAFIHQLIYNGEYTIAFSSTFPARRLETLHTWQDLVLPDYTMQQVEELKTWVEFGNTMLREWDMYGKVPQGYKVLFYGESGTGKTLTAGLLGKYTQKAVYVIDLSSVVSKYIGETEKNLAAVFDEAEKHDWILFFDEADALFGKRTNVKTAHDRYANQEVSYLLQRLETYKGLVVLSSNYKSNIDDAFARRFQSMIYFPMPDAALRLRLWQNTFSAHTHLHKSIDLNTIAADYKLSGGNIVNVVRYASLMAIKNNTNIIQHQDIIDGIVREFDKRGEYVRV